MAREEKANGNHSMGGNSTAVFAYVRPFKASALKIVRSSIVEVKVAKEPAAGKGCDDLVRVTGG